jgi:WD40 repeat protein
VGNSTLLTGGEDGVVRVWRLSQDPSALDKASGTSLSLECPEQSDAKPIELPTIGDKVIQGDTMVTLTFEYRGHKKRIKDIHVDPSHRNLVVTSSEDQTCNLWRLTELITIWKFSKDDALDTAYQLLGLKILTGARKHQFRCVRFSNNGRFLYTALTPARGDSVLIKWKPQTIAQEHEEQWQWVVDQAVIAGESPVGSICVSPNDRFICAAAVSGEIKVFLTEDFTPYIRYTNDQHTFAITGMSFSRSNDKQNFYLVSGGADKKILRHLIPLKGGNLSTDGFLVVFINTLKIFVNRLVCFGMSLFLGMTLLFIMLFFLHAKQNLLILDTSPFHGFEDIFELEFLNSFDAQVTFCLTFLCSIVIWFLTIYSNVTNLFFWNGLVCFFSDFIAFFIAISPEMKLTWQTGEKPLDELLGKSLCCID